MKEKEFIIAEVEKHLQASARKNKCQRSRGLYSLTILKGRTAPNSQ